MAFSYTQQHYTPEELNPMGSVLAKALGNYQEAIKSQYARPQAEADIFAKKFGPLAQIATSPLAQYMLPEQRQQILGQLSQLLSQGGGMGGVGNSNGQEHQGLISKISQMFHPQAQQQPQEQMPGMDAQQTAQETQQPVAGQNPASLQLGAQGDVQNGAMLRATAPYTEEPHAANKRITQNGEFIALTPTEEAKAKAGTLTINEKNIKPALNSYKKLQEELLNHRLATFGSKASAIAHNALPESLKGVYEESEKRLGFPSRKLAEDAGKAEKLKIALESYLENTGMSPDKAKAYLESQPYESGTVASKNLGVAQELVNRQAANQREAIRQDIGLKENNPDKVDPEIAKKIEDDGLDMQRISDKAKQFHTSMDRILEANSLSLDPNDINQEANKYHTSFDRILDAIKQGITHEDELRQFLKRGGK